MTMEHRERPTDEVASEGGSPGDLERREDDAAARGSEATATIDRIDRRRQTVAHDETGEGRKSPTTPADLTPDD
jgi:hypothetical protein